MTSRSSHPTPSRSPRAIAPLFALLVALSGCQTNKTALTSTEQAPAEAAPAEQGSAPAPHTPVRSDGSFSIPQLSLNGNPPANAANAPGITAKAAILIDHRGRVLFEKNADRRIPVASTQKLLLGLMIAERGNLSQRITIQDVDTWCEPTKMGIKAGQTYTRDELLRAVLVRSSNDIARALARDHSGSVSAFAANMNVRARQLGLHNSYFTNASGLPSPPGQYSTARDLAKLGQICLRNPTVAAACRTKGLYFRFSDGTSKPVTTTNQVLRHFPYCTGLKTGYTKAAGRCLVSSATANGKSVVAVILGSKTPTVWEESDALLRYGLGM